MKYGSERYKKMEEAGNEVRELRSGFTEACVVFAG